MKISRGLIRLAALFTILVAGIAPPASAGIYYKAVTTIDNPQGKDQQMVVEGRVEGEKARVEFQDSDNPMMGKGSWLLTTDGGKTIYLVNPKDKTYAKWDMDAMMQFAGAVMEGMGGLVNMEFSDPQVEKLLEEDGGVVVGLPTRHYRYRTTYSMQMKVFGMKQANSVESLQDIWSTRQLDAAALGIWLRKEPPSSGNEKLDRLMRAEVGKIEGFPLKTVTVTTTRNEKKGKESVSRSTTEVTQLSSHEAPQPPTTWTIPAGYQETELLPAGQEGQEDNPLGAIFGRKKKDG